METLEASGMPRRRTQLAGEAGIQARRTGSTAHLDEVDRHGARRLGAVPVAVVGVVVVVMVAAPRPVRAICREVGFPVSPAGRALLVAHVAARTAPLAAALRRRGGLAGVQQLVEVKVCHGLLQRLFGDRVQQSADC